ncbi:hypothetical protein [Pseudactinotalea suaedae]|uniref:hypothetical protein n=1 Tax=Pseudactinotalea suaedae TaxID=1524924 RepID=UPI0012E0F5E2|nr:hypothetical protein [Pseudactinotalea suaedae]
MSVSMTTEEREAIAARYLGAEAISAHAAGPGLQDDALITLRVERSRTIDLGKAPA